MDSKMSTLYVGNLHPEVTESMLVQKFSPAGQIHSVHVCKCWKTHVSLGYAYVNFYKQPEAERALATLNNKILIGKPMRVMWCQKDSTLRKRGVGNLFIKNLDLSMTNSTALFDFFSVFGKVLSCKFVTYKKGPKGYGYVQFESQEVANLAKEELDGKVFNNHKIEGLDLYLKNLDDHINEEFLHKEFSKFGTVTGTKVIMQNGRSMGYGFVRFSSAEDAMKAKEEINDIVWGEKKVFVDVAQRQKGHQNAPVHSNVQRTGRVQTQNQAVIPKRKVKQTKKFEQEQAPPEDRTVEEEPAPLQDTTVEEEPAPLQDTTVEEELFPPQYPFVKEKTVLPTVPAVEEEPAPLQDRTVEEEPAPPQYYFVEEGLFPPQYPFVEKKTVLPLAPAVEEEPAPPQYLFVEEEPFPPQCPFVEEKTVLPLAPAVVEEPAPPQYLFVEEETFPPQYSFVEEKTVLPLAPAVEEEPAPPQDRTVEEEPFPPQCPFVEEKTVLPLVPAVEEEPAPPQNPFVKEEPFPPQYQFVEEKTVLPLAPAEEEESQNE
ncbi:polyadenylate-binding protein 1 [Silurus asotus]|uniref:Polyadenylate-binding protein 1 n=1 Tax=Silurus asotus TaxID=30991 RepID=A0AAD5APU4_SILAS|nr:polyadenylate-binding protein 1 [Silurus asotus]